MSQAEHPEEPVHLPSPTPWPLILALGMTLLPAGFVAGPSIPLGPAKLPVLSVVGLAVMALALFRLIREDILLQRAGEH